MVKTEAFVVNIVDKVWIGTHPWWNNYIDCVGFFVVVNRIKSNLGRVLGELRRLWCCPWSEPTLVSYFYFLNVGNRDQGDTLKTPSRAATCPSSCPLIGPESSLGGDGGKSGAALTFREEMGGRERKVSFQQFLQGLVVLHRLSFGWRLMNGGGLMSELSTWAKL